jgi:hypothetical protein
VESNSACIFFAVRQQAGAAEFVLLGLAKLRKKKYKVVADSTLTL